MKKYIFDISTLAAVASIGAGVFGRWGWPEACIVVGALVLIIAFIEIALFGRKG